MKGNHILPDKKDESPRVAKGKESRLITNAKPKDEKVERKVTSKLSDKPSKDVQRRPPAGVSKASNLKKSNMTTTTKAKGPNNVTDEQIKPKLSNDAGVITQSELLTIIESLRDGDASILRSIAGMKEEHDKLGSANEGKTLKRFLTSTMTHMKMSSKWQQYQLFYFYPFMWCINKINIIQLITKFFTTSVSCYKNIMIILLTPFCECSHKAVDFLIKLLHWFIFIYDKISIFIIILIIF